MRATLNAVVKILAFGDEQIGSNPRLKFVDWLRDISGVAVSDPKSEAHRIEVGQSKSIFDGSRSTTLDGTSAFSVALLPVEGASRYRITHTGGANPTFRTGRGVAASGVQLTFTANANNTMGLVSAAPLFGSVIAGDYVFIPNTTTGDAVNVISVLNSGYWQVLVATNASDITLVRLPGASFEGASEVVTPAANSQLRAYSSAGVQVDDSVDISAGFSTATRQTFPVAAVTDAFVEIISTPPLPSETGITPTAAGMIFYQEVKSFVYVEAGQEVVVRLNGDTGNSNRLSPVDPSDPLKPGVFMKRGPAWSLTIANRAAAAVDVTVIHAE